MADATIQFDDPMLLAVAGALVAVILMVWLVRRRRWRMWMTPLAMGLIGLALAAGGPVVRWPRVGEVAVMVDVSPSTRSAEFRDPSTLSRRVRQLVGDVRYRVYHFAAGHTPRHLGDGITEQSTEETRFTPPPADAIVLFSDGQWATDDAISAPVYPVLDAQLEQPDDGAVRRLTWRAGEPLASVTTGGSARALQWNGGAEQSVPPRTSLVVPGPAQADRDVAATLTPGDLWPENDAMTLAPPPPETFERWWVGENPPGGDWVVLSPGSLSIDENTWLAPSLVVLANQPADAFSAVQRQRLGQYVRDLGGSLLILGGDRAFAAGHYAGTELEDLSPLASMPPQPARQWVLLTDASGSMAGGADSQARWPWATRTLVDLIQRLPPNDPIRVGGFAAEVTWWSTDRSAGETSHLSLPPTEVAPHGPTNLDAALESLARSVDPAMPTQAIVLTDGQATFDDPAALTARLRDAHVTLNVLAIEGLPPEHPLRQIVAGTGGQIATAPDPSQWSNAARRLGASAAGDGLRTTPLMMQFTGDLATLPARAVELWNRTWAKVDTEPLATGNADDMPLTMAARWRIGLGEVAAIAAPPSGAEIAALADLVGQTPRDPRLSVTWDAAQPLHVTVDAIDSTTFLNDLSLSLSLLDPAATQPTIHPLQQTAPGHYEASVPAPRRPVVATLVADGRAVDRRALAGRAAQEFDRIGTDRSGLAQLAERTGGRVIEPQDQSPIDFRWPMRDLHLAAPLSGASAGLILFGLTWWRRR